LPLVKIKRRISLQNFTQIRAEGSALFHGDKRTTVTKPPHVSRNFVTSPKTIGNYQGSTPRTSPRQEQLCVSYPKRTDFIGIRTSPVLKCKDHEYMEHYLHSPHTPS